MVLYLDYKELWGRDCFRFVFVLCLEIEFGSIARPPKCYSNTNTVYKKIPGVSLWSPKCLSQCEAVETPTNMGESSLCSESHLVE